MKLKRKCVMIVMSAALFGVLLYANGCKESEQASEASEGAMKVLDEATGGLATKVKEVGGGL